MMVVVGETSIKSKCKDCERRYPGCHDHCEDYQKAKKARNETSDWLREINKSLVADPNIYYHKSIGRWEPKPKSKVRK